MGGFANFYPCTPGEFSHDNWTCDSCDNPTFNFSPGSLFVPQNNAASATATATTTVTVTGPATGTAALSSSAAGGETTPVNATSCPSHDITPSGVGVGLSVGVALTAIAALVGFLLERKGRRAAGKLNTNTQVHGRDQRDPKACSGSILAAQTEADSHIVYEIDSRHKSC